MINRGMANCSRTDYKAQEHNKMETTTAAADFTILLTSVLWVVVLQQQRNLHSSVILVQHSNKKVIRDGKN